MYMLIIFERNYHRKLLQKTGCNYLLPFWNCDNFFTAIKIRFLKICRKMVEILSYISRKLSHEGIFFFAYLERACRNWPHHEFSWKNQLANPTVSYSLNMVKFAYYFYIDMLSHRDYNLQEIYLINLCYPTLFRISYLLVVLFYFIISLFVFFSQTFYFIFISLIP